MFTATGRADPMYADRGIVVVTVSVCPLITARAAGSEQSTYTVFVHQLTATLFGLPEPQTGMLVERVWELPSITWTVLPSEFVTYTRLVTGLTATLKADVPVPVEIVAVMVLVVPFITSRLPSKFRVVATSISLVRSLTTTPNGL